MIFLLVTLIVMYFWFRTFHNRNRGTTVMSLEESRRTQRPYRYGMMLLCVGALINWVGLAENYSEPVRYAGVVCILAGALLICTAMCCWLQTPNRTASSAEADNPIHVISMPEHNHIYEKPPDYEMVANLPPTYDDAIKLSPSLFLVGPSVTSTESATNSLDSNASHTSIDNHSHTLNINDDSESMRPSSSSNYQHFMYDERCALPNEIKPADAEMGGGGSVPPSYSEVVSHR